MNQSTIPAMWRGLSLFTIVGWLAMVGCSKGPYQRDAQPVSFRIFEVVDCKPAMQPMTLSGGTGKYCVAAQPMVTERDVRAARDSTDASNQPVLNLYFTLKVGERLRAETERINNEHSVRGDHGKLAIVIDGKLARTPELYAPVADTVAINGFTREEAKTLAGRLNASRPQDR